MSFLDDIVDVGSSVWDWATGSSMSAGVARAAALGYMLKEVQASINKDNEKSSSSGAGSTTDTSTPEKDYGVREEVDPDTENTIPVVYGQAFVGGLIVDAVLSDDNMTMWYCIAVCEKTGKLMSNDQDSKISFEGIYWNNSQMKFNLDGVTASSLTDDSGNTSDDINGLVQVYLFDNGSNSPAKLSGYSQGTSTAAFAIFPNWTQNHTMDNIVFAIFKVTYNREKNITGLGNIQFKIKNTMSQPGDCIYDYMTNTRYGAGIAPEEIYRE